MQLALKNTYKLARILIKNRLQHGDPLKTIVKHGNNIWE
jgi:hypothetical protein